MLRREDRFEFQPGEDYVMRLAAQIAEFLLRITRQRQAGRVDEAFVVALQAQELLFGVPVATFGQWDLDTQVERLAGGVPPADGLERCLLYSRLLEEMARLYDARNAPPLASTTRQLALEFLAQARLHFPDPASAAQLDRRAAEVSAGLGNEGGSEVVA